MNLPPPFTNAPLLQLAPGGRFGDALNRNIQSWALTALRENPGIVGHLLHAPQRLPDPGLGERPLMPWYNEFPGKLLTGMAFAYQAQPSPALFSAGEELAAALAAAQGPDGYLGVFGEDKRFGGDGENWDLWGHYHSAYGLLCWHKAAGSANAQALAAARRALDCVYHWFTGQGRGYDSAQNQTMNLAVSHGFALFYQQTGDQKYLDAAIQIVDREWPLSGDWKGVALRGGEFFQSPLPRWEALHTILTLGTLYEITGQQEYFSALEAVWRSIQRTDRHNTGGFSSGEQAQGTPFATGAIETCCTVAWMALSTEYLRLSRNPVAADELELSLFNGMLGAVMPDGRAVAYNTPMCAGERQPSQVEIGFQHNRFSPDFNCCQANALRGLGQAAQWAALVEKGEVLVNYYGPCQMKLRTPAGQAMTLTQRTAYPADGRVTFCIEGIAAEDFALCLRVPVWSRGAWASVNGGARQAGASGTYLTLPGPWRSGDVVEWDVGITVHAWLGAEAFDGAASLYWGPVLLAGNEPDAAPAFSYAAAKRMTAAPDPEGWLLFTVPGPDGPATLRDFATASQRGPYASWLKLSMPTEIAPPAPGAPDWCAGL